MTNLTPEKKEHINKTLHEKVMGECWCEEDIKKRSGDRLNIPITAYCGKCGNMMWQEGNHLPPYNPSYFDDCNWPTLMRKAREKKWFPWFVDYLMNTNTGNDINDIACDLVESLIENSTLTLYQFGVENLGWEDYK